MAGAPPGSDLQYSQRGLLGVAWGPHISVYDANAPLGRAPPGPYITQGFPRANRCRSSSAPSKTFLVSAMRAGLRVCWCPCGRAELRLERVGSVRDAQRQREREVHQLMDKISPDLISIDSTILGSVHVAETNVSAADQDRILSEIRNATRTP